MKKLTAFILTILCVCGLLLSAILSACAAPVKAETSATPQAAEVVIAEPTPAPTPAATTEPTPEPTTVPTETPMEEGPPDWSMEKVGGLQLNMPQSGVVKLLGEPTKKDEPMEWGADGRIHQSWTYSDKGIELNMAWEIDKPETSLLYRFEVKAPFADKTAHGIGIGSTKDEVSAAYGAGISPEENTSENEIIVGSIFGGLLFKFEGGKVTSIAAGAFAE